VKTSRRRLARTVVEIFPLRQCPRDPREHIPQAFAVPEKGEKEIVRKNVSPHDKTLANIPGGEDDKAQIQSGGESNRRLFAIPRYIHGDVTPVSSPLADGGGISPSPSASWRSAAAPRLRRSVSLIAVGRYLVSASSKRSSRTRLYSSDSTDRNQSLMKPHSTKDSPFWTRAALRTGAIHLQAVANAFVLATQCVPTDHVQLQALPPAVF
jgi:hypothetical protein